MIVISSLVRAGWKSNEFYPQMYPPSGRKLMRKMTFHFLFYHRFQPTDHKTMIFNSQETHPIDLFCLDLKQNIVFSDIILLIYIIPEMSTKYSFYHYSLLATV